MLVSFMKSVSYNQIIPYCNQETQKSLDYLNFELLLSQGREQEREGGQKVLSEVTVTTADTVFSFPENIKNKNGYLSVQLQLRLHWDTETHLLPFTNHVSGERQKLVAVRLRVLILLFTLGYSIFVWSTFSNFLL